jgi:RNA polymerase sigma factor (sigma-70 family)
MTPALSDDRLAQRATKGDERAFAAIYDRYHQGLYRFCLAVVGNPQDAQDALQNTMVKVLRALPGEKRRIQLKPWLYRIARNESIELLRRRRDSVEIEPELTASGTELAETAATRERLRRLFDDLAELPERQRAALVMRELSGLDFGQIGTAFDTSDAVARQTVYEARLSLRQMEEGREMSCEKVTRALSDADGRVSRRREIRAHLRACPSCREFHQGIAERRRDFAAIAPLPLAFSAGLLQGVLGAKGAGAVGAATGAGLGGGGSLAGTVAAGAGKTVAGSVLAKSAATVAVVATVGVGAADRANLIETPLPSSIGGAKSSEPSQPGDPGSPAPASQAVPEPALGASQGANPEANKGRGAAGGNPNSEDRGPDPAGKDRANSRGKAPSSPPGEGGGRPENRPEGSSPGRPAAASPGRTNDSSGSKGQSQARGGSKSKGRSKASSRPPRGPRASGGGKPPSAKSAAKQPSPAQAAHPKGPTPSPAGSSAPPPTPSTVPAPRG